MARSARSLVGSSKHLDAFAWRLRQAAVGNPAGQDPYLVILANVNLSSRQRCRDWKYALRAWQIEKMHVPQPGSPEELDMPPGIDTGKREYRVATYELRGAASSLAALVERFGRDGTMHDAWLRIDAHLPGKGVGQVPRAAAENVGRRQRKQRVRAFAKRGDEAAARPVFHSENEE
jgi:hypothetical protein